MKIVAGDPFDILPTCMVVRYILDERGEPSPCPDLARWGAWHLHMDNRVVIRDVVNSRSITTLFIGLDQVPKPGEPPALWETEVVFRGGALPNERHHYRSRKAAIQGHEDAVNRFRNIPTPMPTRAS